MGAARRFDHEEARRRFAAGESLASLARAFGVSWSAVQHAVDAEARARDRAAGRRFTERHHVAECEECGGRALSLDAPGKRAHNPDGRVLCAP